MCIGNIPAGIDPLILWVGVEYVKGYMSVLVRYLESATTEVPTNKEHSLIEGDL